jgi:transposase-like protein
VFDRLAASVEDVAALRYAGLHSVQYGLVLETGHGTELITGALRSDRIVSAGLAVVSDGAPGIIRATEECLPRSLLQRCLAHKMRNLQSKVPEDAWPEFKARATACYQAVSPALAHLLRDDIAATYNRDLPSAVACLDDDFAACIAHLKFPLSHRRAIRTTNLLERLFGEERPRTKVIPHALGSGPF